MLTTIIVQSEVHFQTLAPLAKIEPTAIYSSYNLLLALGQMTVAFEHKIHFVLSVENLTGRLDSLKSDHEEMTNEEDYDKETCYDIIRDIEDTKNLIVGNAKIIEDLL